MGRLNFLSHSILSCMCLLAVALCSRPSSTMVDAFTVRQFSKSSSSSSTSRLFDMEQIEFKIFPDGRVEETVRGVKGDNCHKITESINESLGKVVASEPTEELYEQELVVEQTLTESVGTGDDSSASSDSWEGQSTW